MNSSPFARFVVQVLFAVVFAFGCGDPARSCPFTEIGVAPSHVNGTSVDSLFTSYSQWSTVADQIDFFKYYGCMYSWCGPIDTAGMVAFMDQHGIDIACEYGDFPSGDNAAYNFGIAEQQLDPVFSAGGQVTAIHLDGPIRRLMMIANPTVDLEQAAAEIVEFWGMCRAKYPNARIGLISNLPNWDFTPELPGYQPYPNFTDQTGVYYLDALNTVYTALVDAGYTLDFFEVDCPYQYYIANRTHNNDADVDNPTKFRSIQGWCRDRGIAFHLVVNAEPRSGYWQFYTGTISYMNRLVQDSIFPDVITIQSWYTTPTANLPEATSYTFMNTARDAFDTYCSSVSGARDSTGEPLGSPFASTWPNPAQSSTRIAFRLATAENVTLEIFDVSGRRVRRLLNEIRSAGPHEIIWDGGDDRGLEVGSGVFFYRLRSESFEQNGRITLIR